LKRCPVNIYIYIYIILYNNKSGFQYVITDNCNQVPSHPVIWLQLFPVFRFSRLAVIGGYRLFQVNNRPACTLLMTNIQSITRIPSLTKIPSETRKPSMTRIFIRTWTPISNRILRKIRIPNWNRTLTGFSFLSLTRI
jgi:hypothetical protein